MRYFSVLLLLLSLQSWAQDTIRYDELIVDEQGETVKTSYRSQVTGTRQQVHIRNGQWLFLDQYGEVIKEVGYRADKREKSTIKHGYEVYIDPDSYDTILIRRYRKGELKEQLAFRNATIVEGQRVISVYRNFGEYRVQEYSSNPGHRDFVSLWATSIEDPAAISEHGDYRVFEEREGDPSLLEAGSFPALAEYNYIQNPEFEVHPIAPYSIMSFTNQVPYWIEASKSPDFYLSPGQARSGTSFIGFRVFTMEKHVEYVQNKLREPLKAGQEYCFTAYLKLSPGSKYATNAIGIQFTQEMNSINVDQLLEVKADIELQNQVLNYKTRWMKIQCTYTAEGGERWMTIGSFKDHRRLVLHEVPGTSPECYYYLDDVSLVPVEQAPECPCNFNTEEAPVQEPDMDEELALLTALQAGETLILKDIHFENDRSTLLPESFPSLYNVLTVLQQHPGMHIELSGHTSIQGELEHNMALSMRRAEAVRTFLTLNGVAAERIEVQGHGPQYPIATNDTEAGQRQNRRVEFKVISL